MPRRAKFNLDEIRASLDVTCPHCGIRIAPEHQMRIDSDHMQCPNCGKQFVPKGAKPD